MLQCRLVYLLCLEKDVSLVLCGQLAFIKMSMFIEGDTEPYSKCYILMEFFNLKNTLTCY